MWVHTFLTGRASFSNALQIYVDNLPHMGRLSTWIYKVNAMIEVVTQRFSHGMVKAIENVSHDSSTYDCASY